MRQLLIFAVLFIAVGLLPAHAQDTSRAVITIENAGMMVELDQLVDEENFFSDVAFNPNGDELAMIAIDNNLALFHDGEVRFLNPETWEETRQFDQPLTGISMAYSGDGTLFAVGNGIGDDIGRLRVIDLLTAEIIFDQRIETAEIRDIAFSPSQDYVAVGLGNAQVLDVEIEIGYAIIDLQSGDWVFSMSPYGSSYVDFLDDEALIAPAFVDGTSVLQVWDFLQEELLFQTNDIFSVSPKIEVLNDQQFVYQGMNGINLVTSLDNSETIFEQIPRNQISALVVYPESSILAIGYALQLQTGIAGDRDGIIRLIDIETGDELIILEGHEDIVTDLAFSPDGTLLASGGRDGTVRLWGIPD